MNQTTTSCDVNTRWPESPVLGSAWGEKPTFFLSKSFSEDSKSSSLLPLLTFLYLIVWNKSTRKYKIQTFRTAHQLLTVTLRMWQTNVMPEKGLAWNEYVIVLPGIWEQNNPWIYRSRRDLTMQVSSKNLMIKESMTHLLPTISMSILLKI